MHKSNGDRSGISDPLADIVRAAGKRPEPPKEHYEQVYAATHAVWQRGIASRRQRRWYPLAAAAAFLALAAALWQTLPLSPPTAAAEVAVLQGLVERFVPETGAWTPLEDTRVHAGTRLRTGTEGSMAAQLAGGGSLRIDSASELVFADASFELIGGTVYFDSSGRAPGRYVEIVTPLGTVRDIGTQFEVRATQASLRVRTRSGEVAVLNSPAGQPLASASGEEIELSADGQLERRNFAPDDPQWRWVESLAVAPDFDRPTVLAYLEWIALETGRRLEFVSENVRIQADIARFLGDPAGLTPSELLVTIAATSDFSYELTAGGSILIGRDDRLQ